MIFNNDLIKKINFSLYKKKHLIVYVFIGFLSISLEISIRKILEVYFNLSSIYLHISVFFGILFAFFFNIKFNFNIPKIYFKRCLYYFFLISIISYLTQILIRENLEFDNLSFGEQRFLVSSFFFIIAYLFHRKFSFVDNRKVGVAIYANGYEDVKKIFEKIGPYPDFIHVDIVDKTMNDNAADPNLSKLELVKAYWPRHEINTHIMSKNPLKLLDGNIIIFSDVIYVHHEIENKNEVIKKIRDKNKIPGLVLHSINHYENIEDIVGNFEEVLVLSINKPGESAQKFENKSYELIKKVNSIKKRKSFVLCVDGGVKSDIINNFVSEKVVSGSDVLNSNNPIKKIMKLQTLSRYEK